jgi:hypothetical protein
VKVASTNCKQYSSLERTFSVVVCIACLLEFGRLARQFSGDDLNLIYPSGKGYLHLNLGTLATKARTDSEVTVFGVL